MSRDHSTLILAIAQTLVWSSLFYIFPAMLLQWEAELHWDRPQLTGAITLAMFVSAASSPVVGRLIDFGHGPRVMTSSTVLGAICLWAVSGTDSLAMFYACWGIMGMVFAGCLYEPCFALVTRARGSNAKRSITRITLIAGFASTISFPVAHWLTQQFDWIITLRVFATVALVIAAPMMWIGTSALERSGKQRNVNQVRVAGTDFLRSVPFWLLASGFSMLALLHGATLHHLLPMLKEKGFSGELAVFVASMIGPSQVFGRLVMMSLENRVSNHLLAIGCFLAIGLSIVLLMSTGILPALVFAFITLFGSAYGMVSILRPVIAREILGEAQFGSKSGVLAMVYLIGAASAPWLASVIWSVGTYDLVLICTLMLSAGGVLLYLMARKRESGEL